MTQYLFKNGNCNKRDGHEYATKVCHKCGTEFCYDCASYSNLQEGGKYQDDSETCPNCGHDYYQAK